MPQLLLILLLLLLPARAAAQCTSDNSAFKSGETLTYDLYFNWKFVWVKCGTASMNISRTTYKGTPAFRTYLITRGSKRADSFFVMRDTLTSYTSLDLTPLYYYKGAKEGKTYRRDEVWYTYPSGNCHVKMRHQREQDEPKWKEETLKYCVYDMISMLLRARSFDAKDWKVGHRIKFPMADGKHLDTQQIVYRGKKDFKVENSTTRYHCLVFSFVEKNKKGKEEDVVTFYITDDANHIPVRLDLNLNFGTAKAFLTGATGLRNAQTAKY